MSFEIRLSPLHKRIIAIALASILPLSLLWLLASIFLARAEYHEELAVLLRQQDSYAQLVGDAPRRKLALARLVAFDARANLFLPKADMAVAASQFQNQIGGIVSASGALLLLNKAEVQSESSTAPVIGIQTRLAFTADIAQLRDVLYRIDQASPHLFVERLEISDPDNGSTAPLTAPHRLRVDLTVAGYMRTS